MRSSSATHRAGQPVLAVCVLMVAASCEVKPRQNAAAAAAAAAATATAAAKAAQQEASATAPKDVLEQGNPRMARAVKAVLAGCDIDRARGTVDRCRSPQLGAELQQAEEAVGPEQALQTYCRALAEKWHKRLRALATARIDFVGQPRAVRRVSESTYRCLLDALKETHNIREMNTLTRVATYLGTALGKEQELLDQLTPLQNRTPSVVAYNSLWPNGRLRVVARLKQLFASGKPDDQLLKGAAVRGLSRLPAETDEEKAGVCELLLPLISDKDTATAGAAAFHVSRSCGAASRDQVLAAGARLVREKRFDQTYVAALGGWGMPVDATWTAAQKHSAVRTLTAVLASQAFHEALRGSALRGIHNLEPDAAKRLARRYSAPATPNFIRRAAETILGKTDAASPPPRAPAPVKPGAPPAPAKKTQAS